MPRFIAAVSIRYAGGGVSSWGGNGAIAVAGRVEGTDGGDALEVIAWLFTAGVSIRVNRYLYVAPGPPSPMDDEAGNAVVGTPACCGSEGVCIRVINRLSVSPGPPSIGSNPSFWGTVAQPQPDARRRRMGITA